MVVTFFRFDNPDGPLGIGFYGFTRSDRWTDRHVAVFRELRRDNARYINEQKEFHVGPDGQPRDHRLLRDLWIQRRRSRDLGIRFACPSRETFDRWFPRAHEIEELGIGIPRRYESIDYLISNSAQQAIIRITLDSERS